MKTRAFALAAAILATTPRAWAYHEGDERIVDGTAYTLRAREARVGLWSVDFAPLSFASLGTDPAPWAASAFVGGVVENGHVKLRLVHTRPLTASVTSGVYHADGLHASSALATAHGSLTIVPSSLWLSSDLSRSLSLHVGATYLWGDLSGDVQGAATGQAELRASAVQLHAMAELRASRVVAVLVEGHAQPWTDGASVRTTTTDAFGDSVGFTGTITPLRRSGAAVLGAVAFSGKNVNARIGGGYGTIFVPSSSVMIPVVTILPEVDLYVRF